MFPCEVHGTNLKTSPTFPTLDPWAACELSHFPKSHAVIVILRMRDALHRATLLFASEMRHTKKVFVPLRTISWLIFVFLLLLLQCSLGE